VEEVSVLLKFQGFRVRIGACSCQKLFRRIGGAFLSRVARLAKSQGSRRSDLSGNGAVPEERDIWSDISGQTGAVSVASNIAEGQGLTLGEFLHFLGQARGSLLKLDTQLAIELDLAYLKPDRFEILDREMYQVLGV
jgi:hypothetical protein